MDSLNEEIRPMTPLGILRVAEHRLTRLVARAKLEAERAESPEVCSEHFDVALALLRSRNDIREEMAKYER